MTNVVSMNCTCNYLAERAARHRRAGRYDEAMALLGKARNQFGLSDAVLIEMAYVYDEIGCEDEAMHAYLRLVRLNGKHKPYALYRLTIFSAQHGDIQRARSYLEHLLRFRNQDMELVSRDMISELEQHFQQEIEKSCSFNPQKRAKVLEKHAAQSLQAGKTAAAQRAIEHALRFHPTARRYTLLACCQLIRMRFEDALASAKKAHELSPGNVQSLCVLADAYIACGQSAAACRIIYVAASRARQIDDLLSVAVESAKAGEDALTLLLTGRILRISPYHTRAMMLRACAHINKQEYAAAKRLLGRLRGLLPEDSVCESYYRAVCAGKSFSERLTLGLDVTREEGVSRASELVSMLYKSPKEIDEDQRLCQHLGRIASWAFHSPMAGSATKMVALALLASLQSGEAKNVLLDLLLDPLIADSMKLHVLQILTAQSGFYPYEVDMGGQLVRLAAGGVSNTPVAADKANSEIVQRVSDALSKRAPGSSKVLLEAFLAYLNTFGLPDSRHRDACAAALEHWYMLHTGKPVQDDRSARRYGVSVRIMRIYVRRFLFCMQEKEKHNRGNEYELY